MTTFDLPASPAFRYCRFGLETHTQTFTSPLSNTTQRLLLAGSRWRAEYTLPRMNKYQAAAWRAFFLNLEGQANTFNAYDPDRITPLGTPLGTPLVNGGSQTGSSLTTDGWTASKSGLLLTGDYFSVNSELKVVTADVSSNGSGQATISFKPALRTSPADNSPLTVTKPTCRMALADDLQALWECDMNGIYEEKTFSAVEVFT